MSAYATRKMSAIASSGLSTSPNKTSARYAAAHRPSVTSQNTRTRLEAAGTWACADGAPWTVSLVKDSSLVINKYPLRLVLVQRACIGDLGGGYVELRRAQFDDIAQPEVVARLRQVEGYLRLLQQLPGEAHAIVCRGGVQPGDAHVPDDAVLQVVHVLGCGLSSQLGLRLPCFEQAAVEDWDRDVHTDGTVTSRNRCVAGGHETGGTDDGNGGVVEGVLRLGAALGCALLETETLQFGTILHRLTDQFVYAVRHGRRHR